VPEPMIPLGLPLKCVLSQLWGRVVWYRGASGDGKVIHVSACY